MPLSRLAPSFHLDTVHPDGVPIVVEWDKMEIGCSVFIPAINHVSLKKQIGVIAGRMDFTLEGHPRIEGGKYGMRFWRLL